MKALFLERPSSDQPPHLSLTTRPKPQIKNGQVLIKVKASLINPSDVANVAGGFPDTTYPRIIGRDFAGIIESGPRKGEEVYGTSGDELSFTQDGSQAEYLVISEKAISLKPKNLSFEQASTIGVPFTTAELALHRAQTKPSDVVLVLGATGAVGSATVQLASLKGCKVVTASRRDITDINTVKDPELTRYFKNGQGPDVVIDTVGDPKLMTAATKVMAKFGRLAFISAPKSGSTETTYDSKALYRAQQSILGCNSLLYTSEQMAESLNKMRAGFEEGILKVNVDKHEKISIEQGVEAYEKLKNKVPTKFIITFH